MNTATRAALFLAGAALAVGVPPSRAAAAPPPAALKVTLAIPEIHSPEGALLSPRTLINQQRDAHFEVVIENVSRQPVYLWDESNSLGYRTLSLLITRADGQTVPVRPALYPFKKNVVRLDRLAPGEAVVREVYYYTPLTRPLMRPLSHFEWEPLPFPPRGAQTVTIQAVFTQSDFAGAARPPLWTGRVVSKPLLVVLENAL